MSDRYIVVEKAIKQPPKSPDWRRVWLILDTAHATNVGGETRAPMVTRYYDREQALAEVARLNEAER